ncbi:hypothetical protein [Nonomuraea sp. SBT364]|uniref:hypothetical protein n=1 Tax=Nonomuraea sp. SBT364 TaxID=1580530 RepID=UPI00066BA7C8|nr:hypothetical protein [Nonomuraea sp. SBT364]
MKVTPIAGAAALLAVLSTAPAGATIESTAAAAAAPRAGVLTCAVGTPPGSPIVFTPPVGLVPGKVAARGALWLSGCRGTPARLRSGWASLRAAGQASCAAVRGMRGRATVTWYDATGRPVGSSRLRIGNDELGTAGALLTGTVTGGLLDGRRSRGGIAPEGGVLGCAMGGLGAMPGTGRIEFG